VTVPVLVTWRHPPCSETHQQLRTPGPPQVPPGPGRSSVGTPSPGGRDALEPPGTLGGHGRSPGRARPDRRPGRPVRRRRLRGHPAGRRRPGGRGRPGGAHHLRGRLRARHRHEPVRRTRHGPTRVQRQPDPLLLLRRRQGRVGAPAGHNPGRPAPGQPRPQRRRPAQAGPGPGGRGPRPRRQRPHQRLRDLPGRPDHPPHPARPRHLLDQAPVGRHVRVHPGQPARVRADQARHRGVRPLPDPQPAGPAAAAPDRPAAALGGGWRSPWSATTAGSCGHGRWR
jgi:hypothetical protein